MSISQLHKQTDDWLLGKRNRIIKQNSGGMRFYFGSSGGGKKPLKQGFGVKNLTSAALQHPEVVVKIPRRHGVSNGLKGIKNNLDYISRNGDLDLEDQDGNLISGKSEINQRLKEYALSGIPQESNRREALNIVLSMPKNTPPDAVKNAVREFAKEEFAGHSWVMVLHTDTDEPHCHLNVLIEDDYGNRLNPRKQDLWEWRLRFAEKMREQGVQCTATRRQHRGKYQKSENGVVRHIQDRGGQSWVLQAKAEQLAQAISEQKRPTSPFLKKQLETQKIIVEEYGALARELYKLGYKKEAKLISKLREQVENGDLDTTMQQHYDRANKQRLPETPITPKQTAEKGGVSLSDDDNNLPFDDNHEQGR